MKRPGTRLEVYCARSAWVWWVIALYVNGVQVSKQLRNRRTGAWKKKAPAVAQANRWAAALPGDIPVVVDAD